MGERVVRDGLVPAGRREAAISEPAGVHCDSARGWGPALALSRSVGAINSSGVWTLGIPYDSRGRKRAGLCSVRCAGYGTYRVGVMGGP